MNDLQILTGYTPGAIGNVVELHATYYAQEWGFGLFFEAMIATGLANFLSRYDERQDRFWIAVDGQRIVGSITIDGSEAATKGAHLRWFILDPEYQGKGVGKQLMGEAMRFCEEQNFHEFLFLLLLALIRRVICMRSADSGSLRSARANVGCKVKEQAWEWGR